MRLPLVVETGDSVRDSASESVGIGESTISEIMLLEVAPASLDVIQLWGVFRQPFEGKPRARGKRLCCQLASVDWPVVENRDQGPGAFGGAVGGAKLVEQGNEVGGALGRAGVNEKTPAERIKGAEHRPLFRLTGGLDAQLGAAPGFSRARGLARACGRRAGPSGGPDGDGGAPRIRGGTPMGPPPPRPGFS